MKKHKSLIRIISIAISLIMVISTGELLAVDSEAYAESTDCSLTAPQKVVLVAKSKSKVKITWKNVKFADGYQIFQYNTKTRQFNQVRIKNGRYSTTAIINKLSRKRNYAFKVRAYRNEATGVKCGAFSNVVKGSPKGGKKNPSKVKVSKTSLNLYLGQTKKITAKCSPQKRLVSKKISFISSNSSVATVNAKGKIRANGYGTAIITARACNGKDKEITVCVRSQYADSIPVLTYHNLTSATAKKNSYKNDEWMGSIDDFAAQMKYLHDNGYKTLSLDEFYSWYRGQVNYPKKTVVITFDDGYTSMYYLAAPILKQYGFKASVFVMGKNIQYVEEPVVEIEEEPVVEAEETPAVETEEEPVAETEETLIVEQEEKSYEGTEEMTVLGEMSFGAYDKMNAELIEQMTREYPNIEIQSHTFNMHYYIGTKQAIYMLSAEEVTKDFSDMKSMGLDYVAYPYGSFNQIAVNSLSNNGYKMAFGFGGPYINATRQDPWYNVNRVKINGQISLKEFKSKVAPQ